MASPIKRRTSRHTARIDLPARRAFSAASVESIDAPRVPYGAPQATTQHDRDAGKKSRLLRHRESCRKSYNKKGTTISALKEQLEAVEATYNALLTDRSPCASNTGDTTSLLGAYMALARVKRDLVLENEELYRRNAASMTLEGRLQQVVDVDKPPALASRAFRLAPLHHTACARVLAEARDDVLRFARSPHKLSLRASVFGWTDYRQVRGNELKFALEKHFPSLSARELVDSTWRIVASEKRCAQLFNPSLQATLEILQRVDDDTLLMYRTIRADALPSLTAKTVFLLSRSRISNGYLVLFRSIDPKLVGFRDDALVNQVIEEARIHATQPLDTGHNATSRMGQDVWIEKYAWAIVYEDGPSACRFHFGGSTMSNVWLKEVLFVALRWEKMAVGPAFRLEA